MSSEPQDGREGVGGYYDAAARHIWLNPVIEGSAQQAQTLAHELGHHFAREARCSRAEGEIIADAAAYLVLGHYGVDAGEFSFDYVAIWASRAEAGAFERKLAEAHQAADAIVRRCRWGDDASYLQITSTETELDIIRRPIEVGLLNSMAP